MSDHDATTVPYATVDVFTQTRYAGNPLAIVLPPPSIDLSQSQKQIIAREFNYSETVIVRPRTGCTSSAGSSNSRHVGEWTVDIFLPFQELPFAGHPVIGTACHVLSAAAADVHLESVAGILHCKAGPVAVEYAVETSMARADIPHAVHVHKTRITPAMLATAQPSLIGDGDGMALLEHSAVLSLVDNFVAGLVPVVDEDALANLSTNHASLTLPQDEGWAVAFGPLYVTEPEGRISGFLVRQAT